MSVVFQGPNDKLKRGERTKPTRGQILVIRQAFEHLVTEDRGKTQSFPTHELLSHFESIGYSSVEATETCMSAWELGLILPCDSSYTSNRFMDHLQFKFSPAVLDHQDKMQRSKSGQMISHLSPRGEGGGDFGSASKNDSGCSIKSRSNAWKRLSGTPHKPRNRGSTSSSCSSSSCTHFSSCPSGALPSETGNQGGPGERKKACLVLSDGASPTKPFLAHKRNRSTGGGIPKRVLPKANDAFGTRSTAPLLGKSSRAGAKAASEKKPKQKKPKGSAVKRLTRRAREMRKLLRREHMRKHFLAFAQTQHNAENVYFWETVENYRVTVLSLLNADNTESTLTIQAKASRVVTQFIETGAEHQVNISSATQRSVLETLTFDAHTFDVAQQEIFSLMASSLWDSFTRSPQFKKMDSEPAKLGTANYFSLELAFSLLGHPLDGISAFSPRGSKHKKLRKSGSSRKKKADKFAGSLLVDWMHQHTHQTNRKKCATFAQMMLDKKYILPAKCKKKTRYLRFKDSSTQYTLTPRLNSISDLVSGRTITLAQGVDDFLRLLEHLVEPIPEHQDYIFELLFRVEFANRGYGAISTVPDLLTSFQKCPPEFARYLLDNLKPLNTAMSEFPFKIDSVPRDHATSIIHDYVYLNRLTGRILLESHKLRQFIGNTLFSRDGLSVHKMKNTPFPGIPLKTVSTAAEPGDKKAQTKTTPETSAATNTRQQKEQAAEGTKPARKREPSDQDDLLESLLASDEEGSTASQEEEEEEESALSTKQNTEIATQTNLASLIALARAQGEQAPEDERQEDDPVPELPKVE